MLDSTQRPAVWKRTFDSNDYDQAAAGWSFVVAPSHAEQADTHVYDTAEPGYGNAGHVFGDALSPVERAAVLEYLKTL